VNPETQTDGELVRAVPEPGMGIAGATPTHSPRIVPLPRTATLSSSSAPTMSPMSILRALRRRSALALGVAILVTGAAGPAAWFLVPPAKFTASARLQVIAQPPALLFHTVETDGGGGDYRRYQSTQQTLVKSRMVLNAALREGKVSSYAILRGQVDPIAWLQEKLIVGFVAGSEVMEISLSGDDPEALAGIVNAVKNAYMDEVVDVDVKRRSDRHATLRKTKERYTELLKSRRETLRRLAETVGSDDRQTLALRQQYAMENMASVRSELAAVQSQRRKLEVQVKMMRLEERPSEIAVPSISQADIERAIDQDPTVQAMIGKLAQQEERYESEMAHLRSAVRNWRNDPAAIQMRERLETSRKSLASRRKALQPIVLRQLQQHAGSDQVARGNETEQELAVLTELESRLNAEIKSVSKDERDLTVNTLDLQSIQEEVAQMKGVADRAGAEVEALNVEIEAPPRVRLIEDAAVPQMRDEKKRYIMIGMITAGSFFVSIFGIAFLELQSRKVDTADEVPHELGLTVVGALPILPARSQRSDLLRARQTDKDRYWQHLLLESVDATRTMLVHAARTGSHRVVMIASAVSGEGKTSLSTYLATSLAQSGMRTLLIDADLRNPSIHRVYDLSPAPGLSELLRGEVDPADAIMATPVTDLHVLAAGQCDRQTIRALNQGDLGPLLGPLKDRFDFVIIDSSPILPVADASIIAQYVDAVLFSIFRDVSSKIKVHAALQRLQCLGVNVLGAVITGVHGGVYGDNYYGSSSYYGNLPESAAASSESSSS
jgi:polysaccharide biosynthesis transport protein